MLIRKQKKIFAQREITRNFERKNVIFKHKQVKAQLY
jgi:hypothetical protein